MGLDSFSNQEQPKPDRDSVAHSNPSESGSDQQEEISMVDESVLEETVLFEDYKPRSSETIIRQRELLRESEAAEAAAIILDDAEPLDLDYNLTDLSQNITDPKARQLLNRANLQNQKRLEGHELSFLHLLYAPGAQFVYALLIIATLGGMIGLAATIESPTLVLVAGIASPILLPLCIWKWIRWLDSTPYYYRLLTSLGEDARNLLDYRLFWKRNKSSSRIK
ncbi:MAG: hypothetical protein P1U42_03160 [Phycisphaerales bacterium]|nr:hypothetical protein [Phycisphaerales bacterium]